MNPIRNAVWIGCALAMLALVAPASAQAAGDPAAAQPIVAEHCVNCHEIPGYEAPHGRAPVDAPPFQTIADQPQVYTVERLRSFLAKPHFPMTKFILSSSDIDNLTAFIELLRRS